MAAPYLPGPRSRAGAAITEQPGASYTGAFMRRREESVLHEVLPPEERVIEAVVARYQRVAPAVTRFARTMAGNEELRVRLGTRAAASASEIVIDPGVFQAAYARNAPVTPTEVALTSALHEVVHLIATDLDEERPIPPSWRHHQEALEGEDRTAGLGAEVTLFADEPIEEEAPEAIALDEPMPLLHALHEVAGPAAEAIFLSVEDARQERRHFTIYPGAWSVLADLYRAATPGAMADARPLGQFALACFLVVGGYFERDDLQRRLAPHVALALDDAMAFLEPVEEIDDPWTIGTVALQLLEVARMHRLLTVGAASDTPLGRKTQMEIDRAAIAEGVDAVRVVTPPLAVRD